MNVTGNGSTGRGCEPSEMEEFSVWSRDLSAFKDQGKTTGKRRDRQNERWSFGAVISHLTRNFIDSRADKKKRHQDEHPTSSWVVSRVNAPFRQRGLI
ncbi:unnamed protein product [Allacma fusca]|uniref:Uncharacterized protein n=1 Tax=Allacma fusca TaxID=39272 RepID=A0A8J2P5J9_9HEXA|nr:unnamed protein product [Allacma fusca]